MTDLVLSVSVTGLCQYEGLSEQIIVEVVEHGIAQPVAGRDVVDWVFDPTSVPWLRKAVRLHTDLDIDWVAVAMVIELLQKKMLCLLILTGQSTVKLSKAEVPKTTSLILLTVTSSKGLRIKLSVIQQARALISM